MKSGRAPDAAILPKLRKHIISARRTLRSASDRSGGARPNHAEAATVEELSCMIEELQATGNELRSAYEELSHARDALEAERRRYHDLFEFAPDGYLVLNPAGGIIEANQAAKRLLGISHVAAGQYLLDYASGPSATPLRSHLANHDRQRRVFELDIRTSRGDTIPCSITITQVRNSNGSVGYHRCFLRDVSERKRVERELAAIPGRLMRVRDEEQRRIGRELHDSVAQNLAALSMNLCVIENGMEGAGSALQQAVRESLELADVCSREIRTLSYLLHPPLLDEVGLTSAVRWYVEGFSRRSKRTVELNIPAEMPRLDRDIETSLFRILQECLSNAHRHTASKVITVDLRSTTAVAVLSVADRGRGIPADILAAQAGGGNRIGVGLTGMRERARQLGGRLEIQSNRRGTKVTASIPLFGGHHGTTTNSGSR